MEENENVVLLSYRNRIERQREGLVVSSGYDVIGKTSTHGHALLLVDQKGILLHFNVLF